MERRMLIVRQERIVQEIIAERDRQDAKFGDIESRLTMPSTVLDRRSFETEIIGLKIEQYARASLGRAPSWTAILAEEVGEAFQELDRPERLRAELVQVAAVVVAWIEAIDLGGAP